MEKLKEVLGKYEVKNLLDVGTGRGQFIQILVESLKSYDNIIGIDYNDKSATLIEEKFKNNNVEFIKMDCAKLTYEDDFFDAVSISNTLHELSDIKSVLGQIKRVLNKDGIIIFHEMFRDNQSAKQMSHVKLHHYGAKLDRINGRIHNSTFQKQEILDIINSLNMSIVELVEYNTHDDQLKDNDEIVTEEWLADLDKYYSQFIEELRETNHYNELVKEKNDLVHYVKENGFFTATQLLVIIRK